MNLDNLANTRLYLVIHKFKTEYVGGRGISWRSGARRPNQLREPIDEDI
jgi:hypothetical protein